MLFEWFLLIFKHSVIVMAYLHFFILKNIQFMQNEKKNVITVEYRTVIFFQNNYNNPKKILEILYN